MFSPIDCGAARWLAERRQNQRREARRGEGMRVTHSLVEGNDLSHTKRSLTHAQYVNCINTDEGGFFSWGINKYKSILICTDPPTRDGFERARHSEKPPEHRVCRGTVAHTRPSSFSQMTCLPILGDEQPE